MANRQTLCAPVLAIFLTVAGIVVPASMQARMNEGRISSVHTPQPGSAERKAILDSMRSKVKELHGLDVVFNVLTMNSSGGWAWVHTMPQSSDGRERYEDFAALLHNDNGRWQVDEIACTEPDNPDCLGHPGYFRGLARRFPGVPSSIFPTARYFR